jgi:exopolysaccharide biosynthesis protein
VATAPGRGAIPAGSVVLVGREAGADDLRKLEVGDRVSVSTSLVAAGSRTPYRFAIGGFPILRDGSALTGLNDTTAATRTSAGFGDAGRTLYLLALDGNAETGAGLTVRELASLMSDIGATGAVNLDGGGSSTLVSRRAGAAHVTVRNHPSGGAERPVPNAIGVFSS